ncbi:MAG: DUF4917 family protein, partial [Promicromonosporaceae bacterium]|nr:DUF4917 family protein [Promicromonosporaceae bacterium]
KHGPKGRIIDQVNTHLSKKKRPLVVTGGTADEKLARIKRFDYLRTAHKRFAALDGSLFMHGVSLSTNDEHIFRRITTRRSDITVLYIGLYGNPSSEVNQEIQRQAVRLQSIRTENDGKELAIEYYDSATAEVWRPHEPSKAD